MEFSEPKSEVKQVLAISQWPSWSWSHHGKVAESGIESRFSWTTVWGGHEESLPKYCLSVAEKFHHCLTHWNPHSANRPHEALPMSIIKKNGISSPKEWAPGAVAAPRVQEGHWIWKRVQVNLCCSILLVYGLKQSIQAQPYLLPP
jgi:hypothetical protein